MATLAGRMGALVGFMIIREYAEDSNSNLVTVQLQLGYQAMD